MQKVIFFCIFCTGRPASRLVLLVHLVRRPKQRFKAGNRIKSPASKLYTVAALPRPLNQQYSL